jgi:co-chaperonin GroES (HSP10)
MKKVVECKPVGSQVMVEHLTDQEMLGTKLAIVGKGKNKSADVQQSYVVAVGPNFKEETWGFKVGDRVMVVGSYNPVPVRSVNDRELGIVEPHNVRGVLIEIEDE